MSCFVTSTLRSSSLKREEYLWGGGFWEESYYVGTAGNVLTDTIEQYIE
ncbi:transposase [Halorubrum ezzemoulense]